MGREADPHDIGRLAAKGAGEQPQVVGVGLGARRPGRERAAVECGVDVLRSGVVAGRETDADADPARRDAVTRPGGEVVERGQSVGEGRGQRDARVDGAELGVGEQPGEDRECEVELAELADVEGDRLPTAAGGLREQRTDAVD